MDIIWFYLLAILPFIAGGILYIYNKQVTWQESTIGAAFAFLLAGIFHGIAISQQSMDVETWSGELTAGRHSSAWREYYESEVDREEIWYTTEKHTVTDSNGVQTVVSEKVKHSKMVFDHWESHKRWHDEEFYVASNIATSYDISKTFFFEISGSWGGETPIKGMRTTWEHNSRMIEGNPYDYIIQKKDRVWPVTKHMSFENRIKAAPTVFSYAPVPKGINVFEYPANSDPFHSNRLLGTASLVDLDLFDQMNARLGPSKKVNVILVGFGDQNSSYGQYQEAAWIGGKKNDVVICYGGPNSKPTWSRAFGWTEKKTCLRNLEGLILDKGVGNDMLTDIANEINENYIIKDWSKFDYISIPIPSVYIIWYLIVLTIIESAYFFWATRNEFSK